MSEDARRDSATHSDGTAAGEFIAQMVRDLGDTVSREVEQLRTEASQRTAGAVKGAQLLAGAGAAGAVGVIALGSLPIMALRRVMPGWVIAVGVAGGAGALTAVLTRRGLKKLAAPAPADDVRSKNAPPGAAGAGV
ncbi:MAG TPA: phage holin family protein [Solirubrobacteraceae bacterium]|nr:phage holin family protein [Solirubrobacteraceae bacterium]